MSVTLIFIFVWVEWAVFDTVQFSSVGHSVSDSLWPHELQHAKSPCPSQLPEFIQLMSIELVMPSSHLTLCHPLFLLPSIFPSIRVFSNESTLHVRWSKYWSFSFNISLSNEHPGLIFRMDRLDLLAVQGTLKSLLQHHSSKASILGCSAFFTVQLSHPYVTTGKTIALTRWTFVGKVMSLLFHMLSRLVITFLPRGKCLLTSWLQIPPAVILEPPKIKSDTVSTVFPSISHEDMAHMDVILAAHLKDRRVELSKKVNYMHVKLLQSCLTLCDAMDCIPPGYSVHGVLQARILQ